MERPSATRIGDVFREIFGPEWNRAKLSHSATQGHLLLKAIHTPPGAEVVGRGTVWKLLLAIDSSLNVSDGLNELRRLRTEYVGLLKDAMRAPDGTFPESLVVPGEPAPRRTAVNANLAQNNPLSLDESNPWQDYFTSLELRKTIQKDVERTFPDVEYFRSANAQRMLADVLFVYTKTHTQVSYRQGMHELLAPVLWALDYDSLEEGQGDPEMQEFLAREYVPADAWAVFSRIMAGASPWYEWREPPASGPTPPAPWVPPINTICAKIGGDYLRICDPTLGARMDELGIEPQMYGIRWLRLLFTREFAWRDSLILWDALFATDPTLQLAPWICVAMLMRIRNLLIPAEYTTALTHVLRYPLPPSLPDSPSLSPTNNTTPDISTHILIHQALMLQANPSPATGATVVLLNRSALDIPIEAPPPPEPQSQRPRRGTGGRGGVIGGRGRGIRHLPDGSLGSILGERADVIAKGLWDIGGTVQSRVSDFRKNLPDLVRTPSLSSADAHAFPYFQEISHAEPESEPEMYAGPEQGFLPSPGLGGGARTPRTRFEVEREVNDTKLLMRRLGEGVGIALAALSPPDGEANEERKEEARESLAYIQRVLNGSIVPSSVDPEQVLGKTELARRREERAERERIRAEQEQAERERVERERQQQAEREQAAREREQAQREKERERQRERQIEREREQQAQEQAQDPLHASPIVRPAPLLQTSPPRVRTTRAPWERSEHISLGSDLGLGLGATYPPAAIARTSTPPGGQANVSLAARTGTPPVGRAHTPVGRVGTPPTHQRSASSTSASITQPQPKPGPQPQPQASSDPLGAGTLN